EWILALAAGLLLGAHFATWVPSVRLSSVAAATALVTTQPVWAALIARVRGAVLPARVWFGIGVAVCGAGVVTGADVSVSAQALAGDALALVGGMLAAGYVTVGAEVRRSVSTASYTSICYSTAALVLLITGLAAGTHFTGYPASAWVKILALTVGAQFLGHSLVNRVLRTTSPTVVSLAILFESPGASLIAALWLHQRPPFGVFLGLAVLLVGLALVIAAAPGAPAFPALPAE
ncbi:MAG: DMT family transporter, partial [Mycobacteriales bacterium]